MFFISGPEYRATPILTPEVHSRALRIVTS
jgi:hypothetical protein